MKIAQTIELNSCQIILHVCNVMYACVCNVMHIYIHIYNVCNVMHIYIHIYVMPDATNFRAAASKLFFVSCNFICSLAN